MNHSPGLYDSYVFLCRTMGLAMGSQSLATTFIVVGNVGLLYGIKILKIHFL